MFNEEKVNIKEITKHIRNLSQESNSKFSKILDKMPVSQGSQKEFGEVFEDSTSFIAYITAIEINQSQGKSRNVPQLQSNCQSK